MDPRPRIAPNQSTLRGADGGGLTSAITFPKRVTTTGLPVLRTRSNTPKQVALNFEMAMVSPGSFTVGAAYDTTNGRTIPCSACSFPSPVSGTRQSAT